MTEQELFRQGYNAHETAESAAIEAIRDTLQLASVDALMCLADPQWRWDTRGHLLLHHRTGERHPRREARNAGDGVSVRDMQRAALTRVRRATRAREDADERWKESLRGAVAAGVSLRAIAEDAGITAMRVSQIVGPVDDHRKEKKR